MMVGLEEMEVTHLYAKIMKLFNKHILFFMGGWAELEEIEQPQE
jgi:hypothetical protein